MQVSTTNNTITRQHHTTPTTTDLKDRPGCVLTQVGVFPVVLVLQRLCNGLVIVKRRASAAARCAACTCEAWRHPTRGHVVGCGGWCLAVPAELLLAVLAPATNVRFFVEEGTRHAHLIIRRMFDPPRFLVLSLLGSPRYLTGASSTLEIPRLSKLIDSQTSSVLIPRLSNLLARRFEGRKCLNSAEIWWLRGLFDEREICAIAIFAKLSSSL